MTHFRVTPSLNNRFGQWCICGRTCIPMTTRQRKECLWLLLQRFTKGKGWAVLVQWTRFASTKPPSSIWADEYIFKNSNFEKQFRPHFESHFELSDSYAALHSVWVMVFIMRSRWNAHLYFWKHTSLVINREIICYYEKTLLCLKLLSPVDVAKSLLPAKCLGIFMFIMD